MVESAAEIVCRVHLRSTAEEVFDYLTTDRGRAAFWAERTEQRGDQVIFHFPGGERLRSRVIEARRPVLFALTYFNASTVVFRLSESGGGTDLELVESGVPAAELVEQRAGWVSVLLSLKARADHGVDLRNHDPRRAWAAGYVDN